jgi:heme/copper-type cytochrome/quinol oxidase subunit 2
MNNIISMIKKIALSFLSILLLITVPSVLFAQNNDVEMADLMHANGKIYVVVTVVTIILLALLIFLMIIDKKVRKLEKAKNKE